jgi:hypothetical protein
MGDSADLLTVEDAGPLCLRCVECLADADVRLRRRERDAVRREGGDVEFERRFAAEIARLYPGCPVERAEAIARHAGLRGSGRVGRSAAGRALDEQAITLAVVASIRHQDTDYDDLLMSGVAREDARGRIRPAIDSILESWSAGGGCHTTGMDDYLEEEARPWEGRHT